MARVAKDDDRGKRLAIGRLTQQLLIKPGERPALHDAKASGVFGWDEDEAGRLLFANRRRLEDLQYKLFADGRFGLLVVLQAIDAGGKDGTVRQVMTAFNPQGCTVTSFKVPSAEELRHDFLWRVHRRVPPRGEIGVFNRSHYEDVLVARVSKLVPRAVWSGRYDQINDFERMLRANQIHVVKIFLHISRDEQRRRLEDRVRTPHKQWKFDLSDLEKRGQWRQYREAFEAMLASCNTPAAPWYVVPADRKWFRNLAVSQILVDTLEILPLRFPKPAYDPAKIRIPA